MQTPLLSHFVQQNPAMVDVSDKASTEREAVAMTTIKTPTWLTDQLNEGELASKKGPVFQTAILAGVMGAKRTSSLIPLCHAITSDHISVDICIDGPGLIKVLCRVKSFGRTGVEMEALTGASIAALTVYDMCKSLTFDMEIGGTRLLKKTGGKN